MSALKYTPEPWETYGDGLGIRTKVNGFRIVKCDQASRSAYENARDRAEGMEYTRGNAARIVACVNYCAGMTAEQLTEDSAEIVREELTRVKSDLDDMRVEWAKAADQRDELAAIVKQFEADAWDGCPRRREDDPLCRWARAALAKLDGAS